MKRRRTNNVKISEKQWFCKYSKPDKKNPPSGISNLRLRMAAAGLQLLDAASQIEIGGFD